MLLQQVLQSPNAHVRMRGLHLLMSGAAQGPGNIQALRTSGAQQKIFLLETSSANEHQNSSVSQQVFPNLGIEQLQPSAEASIATWWRPVQAWCTAVGH